MEMEKRTIILWTIISTDKNIHLKYPLFALPLVVYLLTRTKVPLTHFQS